MQDTKLPIQQQTQPLPEAFVGAAFGQLEAIQWTSDFEDWWADYKKDYAKSLGKDPDAKVKVAGMRKLLLTTWIESRTRYLRSIGCK